MLYANEIDANGDFYPLECDFEDFSERFIVTYGAPFWMWGARVDGKISAEEIEEKPISARIMTF